MERKTLVLATDVELGIKVLRVLITVLGLE